MISTNIWVLHQACPGCVIFMYLQLLSNNFCHAPSLFLVPLTYIPLVSNALFTLSILPIHGLSLGLVSHIIYCHILHQMLVPKPLQYSLLCSTSQLLNNPSSPSHLIFHLIHLHYSTHSTSQTPPLPPTFTLFFPVCIIF